ncbi:helix-turn-helix transcriptional regulator [Enterobacter roggenkampii]|uniref:helix-turn-helix transcriptional regulator n=1 Tax=Enterobacter roggenkampii TaxID=1812935 RepID=UPI00168139B1|nr:LuxR C-terminal-related transcriptional regulator [Enterobacter roggenkampii]
MAASPNFPCSIDSRLLPDEDFQRVFDETKYDIVLFDAALLFVNTIKNILERRGKLKTIAVVNGKIGLGLQQVFSNYVDGLIASTFDVEIIVLIVNAVSSGFQCVPQSRLENNNANNQLSLLTLREREVLHLLSHGLSNKAIAELLKVNYKTVCVHRYNIMFKLKLNKMSDLSIFKHIQEC